MKSKATAAEYHESVGVLTCNAASTELFMLRAFQILSGCSTAVAQAIFYTLDSLPSKCQLLTRVCGAAGDAEDAAMVKAIITACEKSNAQRRQVAHAMLIFEEPIETARFHQMNPKRGAMRDVSPAYLEQLRLRSVEAMMEAAGALQRFSAKRGVPFEGELN